MLTTNGKISLSWEFIQTYLKCHFLPCYFHQGLIDVKHNKSFKICGRCIWAPFLKYPYKWLKHKHALNNHF